MKTCLTLLMVFFLFTSHSAGQDLEQLFLEQAPLAWKEYESFFTSLSGQIHFTSTGWQGDKKLGERKSQSRLSTSGKNALLDRVNSRGVHSRVGQNSAYLFEVVQKDDAWVLKQMGQTQSDDSAAIQFEIDGLYHQINPSHLLREPLAAMIKQPYFAVKKIETLASGMVRVEFDYPHDYEGADLTNPFNWVQGGSMVLDQKKHWLVQQADLKTYDPSAKLVGRQVLNFEYEPDDSSYPIPSKIQIEKTFDGRPIKELLQLELALNTLPTDVGRQEYRLPFYGIPEPSFGKPFRIWNTLLWIAAGFALLCLGVFFKKRR